MQMENYERKKSIIIISATGRRSANADEHCDGGIMTAAETEGEARGDERGRRVAGSKGSMRGKG